MPSSVAHGQPNIEERESNLPMTRRRCPDNDRAITSSTIMMTHAQKPLAASFAVMKSVGGLTVYWSGTWRDDGYGLSSVFVNLIAPAGQLAVARLEFKHRKEDSNNYETTRSDVTARAPDGPLDPLEIQTPQPLAAARVIFHGDNAPTWCTKWIHNLYV